METGKKIAGLDHLRALAITLVFLFHYRLFAHPGWVDNICQFGWTGVDLFFVLSGYLIAGQVFKGIQQGNFSLQAFFLKRFFRILPAYWVVVAIYFAMPAAREWEGLPPLWRFLTFTQNLGLDREFEKTFSHAWSLCVEEHFYLLFPLCALLLARTKTGNAGAYIVAGLFITGFAIRITGWNVFIEPAIDTDRFGIEWFKWIYYPTYNRLDGLLAGISIAGMRQFYPRLKNGIERYANVLLVTGLLLACVAYFVCIDLISFDVTVWGFPLVAVAYGFMVASASSAKSVLNRFTSKITATIATLSYTIYLVHKMTIHLAQEHLSKFDIEADSSLMFVFSVVVSLIGALILHYGVEKPFMRLRDRILASRGL